MISVTGDDLMTHGPSPMSGSCQQLLLRHKGWEVFDANLWEALSWLWQDGVLKTPSLGTILSGSPCAGWDGWKYQSGTFGWYA